jgi:hypothetical protein
VLVAGLISAWPSTVAIVVLVGALALVLGRGEHADGSAAHGLSASWWAITALICVAGAIGGLVRGVWAAAVLLVPAAFAAGKARSRAREGNR